MSIVSANRDAPDLGADKISGKAFGIANLFAGLGWFKPKKHGQELEYTTREEMQDLFNDDLRGSGVSKSDERP